MFEPKHLKCVHGQYTYLTPGFIVAVDTQLTPNINGHPMAMIASGIRDESVITFKVWVSLKKDLLIRLVDASIEDWRNMLIVKTKPTIVPLDGKAPDLFAPVTYDTTDAFCFKIALLRNLVKAFKHQVPNIDGKEPDVIGPHSFSFNRMPFVFCPHELPVDNYKTSKLWFHTHNKLDVFVRQDTRPDGTSRVSFTAFHDLTEASHFSWDIDHEEDKDINFWTLVIFPLIVKLHQALVQHSTWQRPKEIELPYGTGLTDIVAQVVKFELSKS